MEGGRQEIELTPEDLFKFLDYEIARKGFMPKWFENYREGLMETTTWKCQHLRHFILEIAVKNYLLKMGYGAQNIWGMIREEPMGLTELIIMLYSLCKIPKKLVLNMITIMKNRRELEQEDRILFKEDEEEFWKCVEEKRAQKRKGRRAPEERCLNELRIPSDRFIFASRHVTASYCLEFIYWKYYSSRITENWDKLGTACLKFLSRELEGWFAIRELGGLSREGEEVPRN